MALTLTHDWCINGGAAQASVTSAAFTPAANSIICVRGSCYNGTGDDTGTIVISDSTGGTLTWITQVIVSQLTDGAATNPPPIAIWTAQVGGSPVSMTVTTAVQDGVGFAHVQAGRIHTGHNVATPVIDTAQVIGTTGAVSMSLNSGAVTGCVAFAGICDWGNSSDVPVEEAGTTTQCSLANADIQSSWAGYKDGISGATTIGTQVLAGPLGTNAVAILLQPSADTPASGVLAVTVPLFTVDFTAEATASGDLDISIPVQDVQLSGELSSAGNLNANLPIFQVDLQAQATATATINVDLPLFSGDFTGEATVSGQLDLVLPVPDVNLVGEAPVSGVFNITLPSFEVSFTGTSAAGGQTMGPCGWTIPDPLCSTTWDAVPAEVKAAARDYAALVLWGATGREFGLCEITVRPCGFRKCGDDLWNWWGFSWASGTWMPYIWQGTWFNGCVCPGICCCDPKCAIRLSGDVQEIVEVLIDGIAVDPDTYFVYDKTWLVRTDTTLCWPECPDLNVPDGSPTAFQVTYLRGNPVPAALLNAAAILADEWAKACTGGDCRLSNRVTSLARSGIQIEMLSPDQLLDGNRTGLWEVDAVINAINPYGRVRRGQIYAPGRKTPRMQTWP